MALTHVLLTQTETLIDSGAGTTGGSGVAPWLHVSPNRFVSHRQGTFTAPGSATPVDQQGVAVRFAPLVCPPDHVVVSVRVLTSAKVSPFNDNAPGAVVRIGQRSPLRIDGAAAWADGVTSYTEVATPLADPGIALLRNGYPLSYWLDSRDNAESPRLLVDGFRLEVITDAVTAPPPPTPPQTLSGAGEAATSTALAAVGSALPGPAPIEVALPSTSALSAAGTLLASPSGGAAAAWTALYAAGRSAPTSGAGGLLLADSTLTGTGREVAAVRRGGGALTGALGASASQAPQTGGSSALTVEAGLSATGTVNVQVIEAVGGVVSQGLAQAREVIARIGAALLDAIDSVMQATGFAVYLEGTGTDGIVATVTAAVNPAGTVGATGTLEGQSFCEATPAQVIDYDGSLPSSLTGTLLVDPAGLPSGASPMVVTSGLFVSGTAGAVLTGAALAATSFAVLASGAVTAIPSGSGGTLPAVADLTVVAVLVQAVPYAALLGTGLLEASGTAIPQQAGEAQPFAESAMLLDQVTGAVGEAPTIERSGYVLAVTSQIEVVFSVGGGLENGELTLAATAEIRCEYAVIPLAAGDVLATMNLRADADLYVTASLLTLLVVSYGTAFPLAEASLTALGAAPAVTTVVVALDVSAGVLASAGVEYPEAFSEAGEAALTGGAVVDVSGTYSAPLAWNGLAFLHTFTDLIAPETYLYDQPGASTIEASATFVVDPDVDGYYEYGVAALQAEAGVGGTGQQRIALAMQAVSGCACTSYDAIPPPVAVEVTVAGHAVLACSGINIASVTRQATFGAVASCSGTLTPLLTLPVFGTADLPVEAALLHAPPLFYAGAVLSGDSSLSRTFPGRAGLRASATVRARGSEGLERSEGRVGLPVEEFGGHATAISDTERLGIAGVFTGSSSPDSGQSMAPSSVTARPTGGPP